MHFGDCGSCVLDLPYEEQVKFKQDLIAQKFGPFFKGEFEFFASAPTNYRTRAEFGIWRDMSRCGGDISYTMHGTKTKRIFIDQCPKVVTPIADLMPRLLGAIKNSETLKERLFGVEFVSCASGILAILLYHKRLGEAEQGEIENLAAKFTHLSLMIVARAKKQRLVSGELNLIDELKIDGKNFKFSLSENAFIQPNRAVNEKMIEWALATLNSDQTKSSDMLELYCGHGNFTIPLSFKFRRVLATEISKSSISNALKNCELNGADNISFLRMSADELMQAFGGEREFNRLRELNLKEFDFSHILVDPPRAGLEPSVINFIKNYENIIYISCNPQTLYENLEAICDTHEVKKFAIFDQFAHTHHIECGVALSKKR